MKPRRLNEFSVLLCLIMVSFLTTALSLQAVSKTSLPSIPPRNKTCTPVDIGDPKLIRKCHIDRKGASARLNPSQAKHVAGLSGAQTYYYTGKSYNIAQCQVNYPSHTSSCVNGNLTATVTLIDLPSNYTGEIDQSSPHFVSATFNSSDWEAYTLTYPDIAGTYGAVDLIFTNGNIAGWELVSYSTYDDPTMYYSIWSINATSLYWKMTDQTFKWAVGKGEPENTGDNVDSPGTWSTTPPPQ